ncbi:MAG: four helix bundle protein [Oligoflexia bacterium]|jgi:hypothetical protein
MKTRELPIYGAVYRYAREIFAIKIKLPKSLKHDLGQETFSSAIRILKHIALANRAHDKTPHIEEALLEIEAQWALTRLIFDLRGISTGQFEAVSQRLSEIGRQAQAWLKWDKTRQA